MKRKNEERRARGGQTRFSSSEIKYQKLIPVMLSGILGDLNIAMLPLFIGLGEKNSPAEASMSKRSGLRRESTLLIRSESWNILMRQF